VTSDELKTPDHIPMELIPAPPTSADHTLFMSALKSHAGDHMMSRSNHTRPKGECAISVPTVSGLDENTTPNLQPIIPTMVSSATQLIVYCETVE